MAPDGWVECGNGVTKFWSSEDSDGNTFVSFEEPTGSPAGWTDSLSQAARRGDAVAVTAQLMGGTDPNTKCKSPAGSPVFVSAAGKGVLAVLEAFLSANGLELDAPEAGGFTALAMAGEYHSATAAEPTPVTISRGFSDS